MSVQSNTYVLVGAVLPFDEFDTIHDDPYEALEPYMDSAFKGIHHHNGLCVLYDGMGGRYIAVGRVLAKSDDQNGNYGFNSPVNLTEESSAELRDEVSDLIVKHLGVQAPLSREWVLTHYR